MLSEKIKLLRDERHWTQAEAAAQIGITTRNYQYLEGGKQPKYETLIRLADVYGVSIDWLTDRSSCREVRP